MSISEAIRTVATSAESMEKSCTMRPRHTIDRVWSLRTCTSPQSMKYNSMHTEKVDDCFDHLWLTIFLNQFH